MMDGFKSSYLKHAPYLSSLTEKNQYGKLEMPPGHWGGVEMVFRGKSNILAVFYKGKKKLLFLRNFRFLGGFGKLGRMIVDMLVNFPRFVKGYELFKTGSIPLNRLYRFDIAINNHFGKRKDIDYVYFGELDSFAHKYGIKSKEFIKLIKKIDREVSKLDFDIILSDHGMVDIEENVKVPWSRDCFIDGDMARYWGGEEELKEIKNKLPLDKGKLLDWKDKRFGQLIFLANTGILIYPNFWDKKPSKAMHGYDGKHEEMKAFYLLNEKGKKKDLKAEELHEIFKRKLYDFRNL